MSVKDGAARSATAKDVRQLSHWRRMRLWATAHAVDDFYQGLVPAAVPYFVLERHYSYVGASALAMAAMLGSHCRS